MTAVTCPTATMWRDEKGNLHQHSIIGCGFSFDAEPDDEGFFDCPKCAMCFAPDNPQSMDVIP